MRYPSARRSDGFTLIELMIVVAIISVLTAVAVVGYTRYLKNARMVEGNNLIARIQAEQEAYFGRFGWYCNASGGLNFHPALLPTGEPEPKNWVAGKPAGWTDLGFSFDRQNIYFGVAIVAGTKATGYALDATATAFGLQAARPWYYVIARADLDGVSTDFTEIWVTSEKRQPVTRNPGR